LLRWLHVAFFSSFAFHGANDEKSGFVLAIPRMANAPAFLPRALVGVGAKVGFPSGMGV
jgi:hypothetical protein